MKTKLLLSSALALCAAPALADISADDVWANTVAFYESSGATVSAQQERDGSRLFLNDVVVTYALPQNYGTLTITLPPTTMVEQQDGTVSLIMPKEMDLTVGFDSPQMQIDDLLASFAITQEDFVSTASGTPGDVTYTTSSGAYQADATVETTDSSVNASVEIAGEGYRSVMRITEGTFVEVSADSTTLPLTIGYALEGGSGRASTEVSDTYGEARSVVRSALPASGSTIANLAPALRDGAFIEVETFAGPVTSNTETSVNGTVIAQDSTSSGRSEANMSLSQDGVAVSAWVEEVSMAYETRELGMAGSGDLDRAEMRYAFPVLASDNPQDFAFLTKLENLTLADRVWSMFDPAGAIPRDPADLTIDVVGQMTSTVDFVDFAGLEAAFSGETSPVTLNGLTINALDLALAGVSATGAGAITFAGTNMSSFEGMRPDGSAKVQITGANSLLDTLVAAGFLPESQAGMTRMMMGMFTRVTGDDQVTSEVNVSEDGQVRVNGERVR